MISSTVFSRYARSLADVVGEGDDENAVARDLALYSEIFKAAPAVLDAFDNPSIPRDAKQRVLAQLFELYHVGPVASNFLQVLLANSRIRYFQNIVDQFTRLLNRRKGIVAAEVVSALPLSELEVKTLGESLARVVGKRVQLSARTDSDLLGGLVVQVGSTVYDGSVRRQLSEMRQRLMD
jgi:F-type H+-transporting ATPase subunit delta